MIIVGFRAYSIRPEWFGYYKEREVSVKLHKIPEFWASLIQKTTFGLFKDPALTNPIFDRMMDGMGWTADREERVKLVYIPFDRFYRECSFDALKMPDKERDDFNRLLDEMHRAYYADGLTIVPYLLPNESKKAPSILLEMKNYPIKEK